MILDKENTLLISSLNHSGKTFFFQNGYINNQIAIPKNIKSSSSIFGHSYRGIFTYIFTRNNKSDIYRNTCLKFCNGNHSSGDYHLTDIYPNLYNDYKNIIFVRDPRVVWVLNDHDGVNDKNDIKACDKFISHQNSDSPLYYLQFMNKYCIENSKSLIIKFEDYISNFKTVHKKIEDFVGLQPVQNLKRSSEMINYYITHIDLNNKHFCKNKIKQSTIDYLSQNCKSYINAFGYQKNLLLDDIFTNLD